MGTAVPYDRVEEEPVELELESREETEEDDSEGGPEDPGEDHGEDTLSAHATSAGTKRKPRTE